MAVSRWRKLAGVDEAAAGVANLSAEGAATRRWIFNWLALPILVLVTGVVLVADASPALLHVPLTACFVIEMEARTRFCIGVGLAPGAACVNGSLSPAVRFPHAACRRTQEDRRMRAHRLRIEWLRWIRRGSLLLFALLRLAL